MTSVKYMGGPKDGVTEERSSVQERNALPESAGEYRLQTFKKGKATMRWFAMARTAPVAEAGHA